MYGRTLDRAIGAENTAVSRLWFQNSPTRFTFVEPLTRVCRHNFQFLVLADWASELGVRDYIAHLATSEIKHSRFAGHIKSAIDTVSITIKAT